MTNRLMKISDIKANPNNPRIIKDDKFKKLVESVKSFPEMLELRPIVVNKDMIILGGNMRYKACKEAWIKEIPVIVADNLTEEQEREFLIKDNVSGGEWDWDILANEWDKEELEDWGLDVTFDTVEPTAEEDDFEVDEWLKTDIVLWDLFEIGEHRLLCWDSTNIDDVNKLMNGEKADMIWTDPPYWINEKWDRSKRWWLAKWSKLIDFKDDTIQYAIDAYNQPQNINIPIQVWFWANYYCHTLPQSANWLVWDKRVEDNQRDNNSDCELAWVKSWAKSIRIFRHLWKWMLKDSERWEKRVHATQKPIALVDWCIKEYWNDSKIVLDYFWWSWVCMVWCHQINKTCYTMEFEPINVQTIVNRMQKLDPSLVIKRNWVPYTISNVTVK